MRYVMMILVCVMMAMGCVESEPMPTSEPEVVMVEWPADLAAAFGPTNPIETCQCSGGNLCCRDADRTVWWCYPWFCAAGGEPSGLDALTGGVPLRE